MNRNSKISSNFMHYTAIVVSYSDYEAFNSVASFGGGMLLSGRHPSVVGQVGNADTYNRGFNGMLKDDEIKNIEGSYYDFGGRMYDSRVGRWFSSDALFAKYPSIAPHAFAGNSPISCVDHNGDDIYLVIDGIA